MHPLFGEGVILHMSATSNFDFTSNLNFNMWPLYYYADYLYLTDQ